MQPGNAIARPALRFRRPGGNWEDLRRMEEADAECRRSAERLRYLFAALAIGVAPLVVAVLGGLGSLVPVAGDSLGTAFGVLGVVSFIALLPAQFVVIHKASNSMRLRNSDRLLVGVFCAFFSVAPVVTLFVLVAIFDF